jgi:hypothetical protein
VTDGVADVLGGPVDWVPWLDGGPGLGEVGGLDCPPPGDFVGGGDALAVLFVMLTNCGWSSAPKESSLPVPAAVTYAV